MPEATRTTGPTDRVLRSGRRTAARVLALLVLWLGLFLPGAASATSLQFFGNGDNGIDRATIQIDPQVPADIGSTDFTLEWWMRALPGENASDDVNCDANGGWTLGNVVFDRNIFNVPPAAALNGAFGVSLTGGHVAFGVSAGTAGNTICGQIDVTDGVWHHIAVTRQKSDGRLRVYVDGALDAEGDDNVGNNKDISYLNNQITGHPDADPFLIIGAEKQDASPAYHGWIDEIRLSTVQRYTSSRFTRPFSVFALDGSTAALYHLDEGTGDTIGDAAGGSPGTRAFGGSPAGPEWSSNGAPLDTSRKVLLEQVASGLSSPVTIANAGDDRLFVVEQAGRIKVYRVNSSGPLTPLGTFLDIHDIVTSGGERGLLGLAFHPDYATNGFFFVYYTSVAVSDVPDIGDVKVGDVIVARYHAPTPSGNTADALSGVILLKIDHSTFGNHNAGGITFGPEGYLYIPVGDGGGGGDPFGSGQSLTTHLGKILRINVDPQVPDNPPHYQIPSDNPFADGANGAKPEIWAFGLRNPWRISFDRLTGDLLIGDVGQGAREEVDLQLAGSAGGANYGWNRMEGIACYPPGSACQNTGITLPILDYTHSEGCAVTGGYRYRGAGIPTLNGVYVFTDYCGGIIWGGVQAANGAWSRVQLMNSGLSISTFGEDAWGELYAAHLGGSIHRFARVRPRLTVTRSGVGIGTVNGPGGIACGNVCTAEFEPGESVTLTTAIDPNSWLAGWSGACGGTEDCTVIMNGDRAVTATINPRSVFQFSAPTYTVTEGSTAVITVKRLVSTAGVARIDYQIEADTATAPPAAGADFSGALTGTLTFNSGESTKKISIPSINDSLAEGAETVLLSLHRHADDGSTLGNPSTAVLTIVDNDAAGTLRFSSSTYSVNEGAGQIVLRVNRSGGKASGVTVDYVITGGSAIAPPAPGADFGGPLPSGSLTGTLQFGANVASQTITIPIVNDSEVEPDETFTVTLQNPQGGATLASPSVATVTIVDNDRTGTTQFRQSVVNVQEFAPSVALAVTRTGSTSATATVSYEVTGSTVLMDPGFLTGTVTFPAGQASSQLVLPLVDNSTADGNGLLTVTLKDPLTGGIALGTPNRATVTVVDDEGTVQFAGPTFTVNEGTKSATITLTRTGGTVKPTTVHVATGDPGDTATPALTPTACSPGADYRPIVDVSLTFNAGETTRTFNVPLCADNVVETPNPETFTVKITSVSAPAAIGVPSASTVQIMDR